MRTLIRMLKDNIKYRSQIVELAKLTNKKKYKTSDFGIIWAFIRPAMYITVFYVAISIGFRGSKNIEGLNCPYFVWLCIGMMAWFYMQKMVVGGAGCYRKYRILILNFRMPLTIIPTIHATSVLLINLILSVAMLTFVAVCFGAYPSIYWLQLPIYTILMYLFSIMWSIFTGLLSVVNVDFKNLLGAFKLAVFWLSAIIFDVNSIHNETVRTLFYFNPITFICEGYRNSVCRNIWFFEQPKAMACYLCVFAFVTILAILTYKGLHKKIQDII